jgi:release factor glutamine methyltransferase
VHAVDISAAALEMAQENALRNHIQGNIHWHLGDLLTPLVQAEIPLDLVVANLPYVGSVEMKTLPAEVRWEPTLALDGGREGLAYIFQLIEQAESVLKPEGILLLEIGSKQGKHVLEMLKPGGAWQRARLYKDLAGLPRIIEAEKGATVGSLNY